MLAGALPISSRGPSFRGPAAGAAISGRSPISHPDNPGVPLGAVRLERLLGSRDLPNPVAAGGGGGDTDCPVVVPRVLDPVGEVGSLLRSVEAHYSGPVGPAYGLHRSCLGLHVGSADGTSLQGHSHSPGLFSQDYPGEGLADLLAKQAVVECDGLFVPKFSATFFMAPKKGGKWRPILNLRPLNKFIVLFRTDSGWKPYPVFSISFVQAFGFLP